MARTSRTSIFTASAGHGWWPEGSLPSSPPIGKVKEVSKNEIVETLAAGIDLSSDWREAVGLSIINSERFFDDGGDQATAR
jgi:hypothetical protein